jgi:ABC-type antimicrobial peptide transport system permease subunit
VWLATDPRQHQAIADRLADSGNDLLVGDAQAQLQAFQAHLVSREAKAAFRLNAAILVPLSGLGFLLVQLFTARRRAAEFGTLQALGLSSRQLWRMLVLEGVIIVVLGLVLGSGMGYGLALMMRPFLSHVLASSMGGIAIDQILIDWPVVGAAYAGLVGLYGLALLLLLANVVRNSRST